jgi:dipeptidyl aminopeptidase/acylaminoacyl peptidase
VAVLAAFLLVALGGLGRPAAGQSPSPLRATDLLKTETIEDVVLSPTGRNVAYTVRGAVSSPDEPPQSRSRLYVASSSGRGQPRLLTRHRPARQPAWHPDGDVLAFVRPVDGIPQIFVLSLSGGEPYQLTDGRFGATDPTWSPTGDRLLFATRRPGAALPGRDGRRPPSRRAGRSPEDTLRRAPPESILVLRHDQTLAPVDTLSLTPTGRLRPSADTLRPRPGVSPPPSLQAGLRVDSLRTLPPDSLTAVFRRFGVRPDTMTVPVAPDTAARPTGDLLQMRRWLDQQSTATAEVRVPPHVDTPTYRHYFVVDVPGRAASSNPPRPTPRPVTRGYRSYQGAQWLPGGSQVVLSAPPRDASPTTDRRALYVVDLAPYRMQRLLAIDGYALTAPRPTADGTTLAFRAQALSAPSYAAAEIGLFELDGRSKPTLITDDFSPGVRSFRWSPDGWYLYVTAPTRGGRPLYRFAPFAQSDTADARGRTSLQDDFTTSRDTFALDESMWRTPVYDRVLSAQRVVQGFDVTDSKAVYAALTPDNPSELYANTVSFRREQRLSAHNAGWTSRRRFASAEPLRVWNGDRAVHGRLTPPVSSPDSAGAPLVLLLRGGPSGLEASAPVSAWAERHYLTGRGYGVLEVWPRGSDGFGTAYRRSNFQDWGPGPAADARALADAALTRSWVDSSRQVIAGRAYGGYLAAWLTAHSDRYRAAVAQSGAYDLASLYDEGPVGPVLADQFGGPPWRTTPPDTTPAAAPDTLLRAGLVPPPDAARAPQAALRRNSVLPAVPDMNTPILLLHGGRDRRVVPLQSERLYRRLRALERPVEYVRYPGVGHRFTTATPTQRVDRLVRLHAFFARFVAPGSPPPAAP